MPYRAGPQRDNYSLFWLGERRLAHCYDHHAPSGEGGLPFTGGIVGAGGELDWPNPTRPEFDAQEAPRWGSCKRSSPSGSSSSGRCRSRRRSRHKRPSACGRRPLPPGRHSSTGTEQRDVSSYRPCESSWARKMRTKGCAPPGAKNSPFYRPLETLQAALVGRHQK
jgi:hypothetical protein